MLVLALVVGFQRLLAYLVIRSERVETFVEGTPVELVRDGVIGLEALGCEDLFERLRAQGVRQLGEVHRAYFEQDGDLSLFVRAQGAPAGLPVVPPWDLEPPRHLPASENHVGEVACTNCGTLLTPVGPLPPLWVRHLDARHHRPARRRGRSGPGRWGERPRPPRNGFRLSLRPGSRAAPTAAPARCVRQEICPAPARSTAPSGGA